MRLNMQLVIGAFLTLTMISSCDTFEDEMTPDSYSETIKHVDGNWRLFTVSRNGIDITKYMDFSRFHIVLNKDNTYEIKNYLPLLFFEKTPLKIKAIVPRPVIIDAISLSK